MFSAVPSSTVVEGAVVGPAIGAQGLRSVQAEGDTSLHGVRRCRLWRVVFSCNDYHLKKSIVASAEDELLVDWVSKLM
jgi:hypothetical protein